MALRRRVLACGFAGWLFSGVAAQAVEFDLYRLTASIDLESATFENQVDRIDRVKLSSKKLVNAILGNPLAGKPPANLVLVVAIPRDGVSSTRFGIFDTATSAFTQAATVSSTTILTPTEAGADQAGVGEAFVPAIPVVPNASAEVVLQPFSVRGGGTGKLGDGSVSFQIGSVHAIVFRDGGPGYYASAITKGKLRASGNALATVNL